MHGVSEVRVSAPIELRLGAQPPEISEGLYPLQALLAIESNFYIHFVTT